MNELMDWIASVPGFTINPRSAARAFLTIKIESVKDLVSYLGHDKDFSHRPKGIGAENYKLLVEHAAKCLEEEGRTYVGLTCTNGVSFQGEITKQDYAEFIGVVEALQVWFECHKLK